MMVRRSNTGMGFVPLLWAVPAAVGAGITWLGTCDDWYCTGNITDSIFTNPATPSLGPAAITPAAPQAEGSMRLPGAWSFEDMFRTTAQRQADFRLGTAYAAENVRQAARGGAPPPPEKTDNTLLYLAGGTAAVLVLAMVLKR